jgi:hypothetical protein
VNVDEESALRIKDLGGVMRLHITQINPAFRTLKFRMADKKAEEEKGS